MKIKSLFVALALLVGSVASAQNITVKGSVLDATTGDPVIGYVQLQGQESKVYAEINVLDGSYTISVPAKGVLVVDAAGYKKIEEPVAGRTEVNLLLEVDSELLEGTIVTGYGSAKRIGTLVGAVATVDAEVLKNAPAASALDLLQGQVAGMSVFSTGGVVGDNNISMKIHGMGSLGSSSEPLFIVDGAQSSSSAVMAMNPNDIVRVTVLKDASATSIYGAQGANGVVYVTTKTGNYNSKATITATSQYGISTLANMQFFENMMNASELKDFWMRSGLMSAQQIYTSYTSKGYDADTKWYKIMQRFNNPQYQNDISIDGGSDKVAYRVGASQFHQDGNTWGNYFDRYTVRTNLQAHPKDWLKVGFNINGSLTKDQSNDAWGNSGENSNYVDGGLTFTLNPLYPAIDPETDEIYEYEFPNGLYNPYYYNEVAYRNDFSTYRATGSTFVEITPIKNLVITSRLGTDSYVEFMDRYLLSSAVFASGKGMVQKSSYRGSKNTISNTAEYSFSLGDDHNFTLLAGQEGIGYTYKSFIAFSNGQTDDRLLTLDNGEAESRETVESTNQYRFFSLFGHADYSYKDTYFADFTYRNDASSRFGKDTRHASFWAAGLMWKMANEPFIKDLGLFNDLDFRVSYGTQGNASLGGNYKHLALIGASSKYNDAASMVVAQPSNNELTWEKQSLLTVSVGGTILSDIDFEIGVYDRRTTDMLMSVPFPYTSGFSSAEDNVGSLRNTGVDLTLGYTFINTRDAFLQAHATFNYNREKITELFQGLDRWEIEGTGLGYIVGQPVVFVAPIYAGVDPEDGLPMWYLPGDDIDVPTMDPERTTKEFDEAALRQNTGYKLTEPVNGGFGISGRWKGFSLNMDFAYVIGKTLINNDMYFYANPNTFAGNNQSREITDFWTPGNPDAKWPDWSKGVKLPIGDTHLFEDASFLRLKTFQIGYTLPKRWLGNQNVLNNVMVTFTGRNLLTFTNYTGMDPEVDRNVTLGVPGNTKQALVGIELQF